MCAEVIFGPCVIPTISSVYTLLFPQSAPPMFEREGVEQLTLLLTFHLVRQRQLLMVQQIAGLFAQNALRFAHMALCPFVLRLCRREIIYMYLYSCGSCLTCRYLMCGIPIVAQMKQPVWPLTSIYTAPSTTEDQHAHRQKHTPAD